MASNGRTICLIGGMGFLGTALRRHLRNDGRELIVVGRGGNAPVMEGERYVSADDLPALQAALSAEPSPVIIDLAYSTVPSTSFEDPITDFSANLGSVIRHLQLAADVGAGLFLFISSGGTVYGDAGAAIAETAAKAPLSPYGITKLACEHYAGLFHKTHRVPAIVVRPSNVYGPGQWPFRGQGLVATAFGAALTSAPVTVYGDGSQVRDFLYVDDFCSGVAAAVTSGEPGEAYNLGSGTGTSVRELLREIGVITGRDGKLLRVEWREPRPFDVRCNILDSSKLRAVGGWAPATSLCEGLESTWEWMKAQ